jgi:hypothetical protein
MLPIPTPPRRAACPTLPSLSKTKSFCGLRSLSLFLSSLHLCLFSSPPLSLFLPLSSRFPPAPCPYTPPFQARTPPPPLSLSFRPSSAPLPPPCRRRRRELCRPSDRRARSRGVGVGGSWRGALSAVENAGRCALPPFLPASFLAFSPAHFLFAAACVRARAAGGGVQARAPQSIATLASSSLPPSACLSFPRAAAGMGGWGVGREGGGAAGGVQARAPHSSLPLSANLSSSRALGGAAGGVQARDPQSKPPRVSVSVSVCLCVCVSLCVQLAGCKHAIRKLQSSTEEFRKDLAQLKICRQAPRHCIKLYNSI